MEVEKLLQIISSGKGIEVEFKECSKAPSKDVFKRICAFFKYQRGAFIPGSFR